MVSKNTEKNISIKRKLMIAFLLIGLIPMIVTTCISIWQASNNVSEQAYNQLESLRVSKKLALEEYSNTIVKQVLTLSSSPNVINGVQNLQSSYDSFLWESSAASNIDELRQELAKYYRDEFAHQYKTLNSENTVDYNRLLKALSPEAVALQHAYIYANPAKIGNKHEQNASSHSAKYDKIHADVHPSLRQFLEEFGYYDVFLVDSESSKVVYSVFKELDYATDLVNGPYANSGLAESFKLANQLTSKDKYVLVDYAQYLPSYDSPASFIASPIYDGNKKVGVLIFQMPLDAISGIMNTRTGMGETGEAYLVGADGLLRSNTYKNPEEYSVEASFKHGQKISSESISQGLKEAGVLQTNNYENIEVLSSYGPVEFGALNWALVVDVEVGELFAALNTLKLQIAGLTIFVLIVVMAISLKFSSKLVKPLVVMKETMVNIVETGDFSRRVEVKSNDEIGQSADSFNELLVNLEQTIAEVNQAVGSIAEGDFSQRVMAEVHGDLEKLKNGVNASADTVATTMSSLGELMDALAQGDFDRRMSGELKGDFKDFGLRANRAMESIDCALASIQQVMSTVVKGNLDSRVDGELPGRLGEMKQSINSSMDVLSKIFSDTERVLAAVSRGNLNETIVDDFEGIFEKLKDDANRTIAQLTETVTSIKDASSLVRTGANEISQGNLDLSRRTESQAAALEQTSASMEEITSTVKQNADNSKEANELAINTRSQAQAGGEVVNDAIVAMGEINQASNKISNIISVIDEIAFQTNLLALNAAVEAARAGEQGRGFAVVATEVRNLAGRSASAAKEIKELIEDSVTKVEEGSRLVNQSGETLEEIMGSVKKVASIIGDITSASQEQALGIEQINKTIVDMDTTTQQNTAMVEEAAAAAESMSEQSNELSELVEFFTVDIEDSFVERRSSERPWTGTSESAQLEESNVPNVLETEAENVEGDEYAEQDWKEF